MSRGKHRAETPSSNAEPSDGEGNGSTSEGSPGDDTRSALNKKPAVLKKGQKGKSTGKGKGKAVPAVDGNTTDDELREAQDENKRLHQELQDMQLLLREHQRDVLATARPAQTSGAGSSNSRHNSHGTRSNNDQPTRIGVPKQKTKITMEKMQEYLGLTDSRRDRHKWLEWRDLLRKWVSMANLDFDLTWKEQDKGQLGKLYDLIRERIPEFGQFVSNWGAEFLVQDIFNHHRGHMLSKAREVAAEDLPPNQTKRRNTKPRSPTSSPRPQHRPRTSLPRPNSPPRRQHGAQGEHPNQDAGRADEGSDCGDNGTEGEDDGPNVGTDEPDDEDRAEAVEASRKRKRRAEKPRDRVGSSSKIAKTTATSSPESRTRPQGQSSARSSVPATARGPQVRTTAPPLMSTRSRTTANRQEESPVNGKKGGKGRKGNKGGNNDDERSDG